MNANSLLTSLQQRGLTVALDGDRLKVTPARLLQEDDRATIRAHKEEMMAILRRRCSSPPNSENVSIYDEDEHLRENQTKVDTEPIGEDDTAGICCFRRSSAPYMLIPGTIRNDEHVSEHGRRTSNDIVAAMPHAPCPGGCGRQTPVGWWCRACRLEVDG